jgi:capsular exopolysaccharide synthesis family protein
MSSEHDQHAGLPAEPGRPWPVPGPLPAHGAGGSRLVPAGSSGPLRPVSTPTPPPDPIALLKAFRRRWPLAIGLGLVAAAVTMAAAWFIVPPAKYTTRATLRVFSFRPSIIFPTKEAQTEFRTYQQTQAALIRDPSVLEMALLDPVVAALPMVRAQEDPVEWLRDELQVTFSPMAEVINLALSGDDKDDIAKLLTAVIQAYKKQVVDAETEKRLQRLKYLEKLSGEYVDQLKSRRAHLREMADQYGANDRETLALRTDFAYENMSKAQQIRLALLSEIMQAEADVDVLEAKLASAPPPPPSSLSSSSPSDPAQLLSQAEAMDPEIRQHQARIAELTRQIEATAQTARKRSDPAIRKWRGELEFARRALAARREVLQQQAAAQLQDPAQPPVNPIERDLVAARDRLQRLKLYDQKLSEQIKHYEEEAKSHNTNAMDLQTEQTQVATLDATAQDVDREIQNLKVELMAPPRVEVVSWPNVPKTKDELKKVKIAGAVGAGAFGLTLLAITLLEYRARRIGSLDEVVQGLGLPLVGALPALPSKSQRTLARRNGEAEKWRSRLIESIDATRTMLLHVSRTESIRVVMITSALKGEGKTSLASHLATSLARAGRKTLLVDCDLRRPSLHRLFDVPMEPGLCELLRGEVDDPNSVIHPTPAGDLDVITAGRCDALALQMLAQDAARNIFATVVPDYDFVIVDTSPVLPVADALLLGQQVDAVLFSLMHEVSCVPHVQQAYDRLVALGVRVLGAVVNGAAGSNYGYDGYAVYDQAGAGA